MSARLIGTVVLGLMVAGIMGCGVGGSGLVPATGKVTYNGAPVEDASVTFMHSEGDISVARTNANGEFTLTTFGEPGAKVGEYRVGIRKTEQMEGVPDAPKPEDMIKMMMGKKELPQPKSLIPEQYGHPQTSDLKATVTTDKAQNNFTFALTD